MRQSPPSDVTSMSGGSSQSSPNSPQGSPEASAKPSTAEKPLLTLPRHFQLKLAGFSRACSLLDRPAVERVSADFSALSATNAPEDLEFLSPELLAGGNATGKAVRTPTKSHKQSAFDGATDMWSAALFGALLLTGRSLFHRPDAENTRTAILKAAESGVREALVCTSGEASQLLCSMLSAERSKRPNAEQVLQSGWMKALEAAARLEGGASAPSAENAPLETAQPQSPSPSPDPDSDRVRTLSNSFMSASALAAIRAVLERRRNYFESCTAPAADSDPLRTLITEFSSQSPEESAVETVA